MLKIEKTRFVPVYFVWKCPLDNKPDGNSSTEDVVDAVSRDCEEPIPRPGRGQRKNLRSNKSPLTHKFLKKIQVLLSVYQL